MYKRDEKKFLFMKLEDNGGDQTKPNKYRSLIDLFDMRAIVLIVISILSYLTTTELNLRKIVVYNVPKSKIKMLQTNLNVIK
jgi:hypothetical protein